MIRRRRKKYIIVKGWWYVTAAMCVNALINEMSTNHQEFNFFFLKKRTYCEKFMCRNLLLTFCNCVEEQILQTGKNACVSSPSLERQKNNSLNNEKAFQRGENYYYIYYKSLFLFF